MHECQSIDAGPRYVKETHFICLHLGGTDVSAAEPLRLNGGSSSIDVGVRSVVGRSLMTKAWPPGTVASNICHTYRKQTDIPMASAEPGRISEVVTPPAMVCLNPE